VSIVVREISKSFGDFTALHNISLEVPTGSLTALLGPSGSGKSTLLRVIAGLERPDTGEVLIAEEDVTGAAPQRRGVGFVFQHYAAFKHMTVYENVAFGLRIRHRPRPEIRERVGELLRLVQLEGFASRYPAQLSGGQRQRMGLARALAVDPKVLLLDEPFRALDSLTKSVMHEALLEIYYRNKVTIFFITHDLEEAIFLGHRVAIMTTRPCKPKKILEVDIPHPRNYGVLTSPRFRELMEETVNAVHEEAVKAFEAGEKEM
jgi:ABC-type sulfate/molybdate transport systems ATPase subunit